MSAPNLLTLVEEVRARVPNATPTDDELAWMLNEIAWRANGGRAVGPWGLSAKASGTRIRAYRQHVHIAHDILHYAPDNELIDVFTAAGGGPATPTWSPQGPPRSADRVFVPPVPPESFEEEPADADPPAPASPGVPDLSPVLAALAQVAASVASLRESLAALDQSIAVRVRETVAAAEGRLAADGNAKQAELLAALAALPAAGACQVAPWLRKR